MIIFKDWLKEKGALEEYEKFFNESYRDFNYNTYTEFIDSAFKWGESDSGEDYWLEISNEWDDIAYDSGDIIYFSNDYVPETPVNEKPIQYQIGIDTFDRMKANASFEEIIGGCKLNIDKYIWRKKGSDREDWEKARDYIELGLWAFDNKMKEGRIED